MLLQWPTSKFLLRRLLTCRNANEPLNKNCVLFPPSIVMACYSRRAFHQPKIAVKLLCLSEQKYLFGVDFRCVTSSINSNSKKREDLVILLGQDDSVIGIKTMEEAEELAKKKKLRLLKLEKQTPHKKYPVYQLISAVRLIEEDEQVKGKQLEEKNLTFTYRISDHDLQVKINTIEKWLKKKNYKVKVFVTGELGKEQILEGVYKKIEDHFSKTARLLQKVVKNGNLKFYIQRPKE